MKRCLEWKAGKIGDGYVVFRRNGKPVYAHREMYECTYGPIPKGMFVCHTCDNPSCINPEHLFLGTPADNVRDMLSKQREQRGESRWNARLTKQDIAEIRSLRGLVPQRKLAARFGVHQTNISAIQSRRSWRHLP